MGGLNTTSADAADDSMKIQHKRPMGGLNTASADATNDIMKIQISMLSFGLATLEKRHA